MLANFSEDLSRSGTLSRDVHLPATFFHELLDFIASELPEWRDRPDRKPETAETALTSQLCRHLNSAARHAAGWDVLQFQVEGMDERHANRKIDLVPAPCGATIWIEDKNYTDLDSLLPIECKRLPTPKSKDRDEREYVTSRYSSSGGIQRFKAGYHGAAHPLGAMIGYVQEDVATVWFERVTGWIGDLVTAGEPGWTIDDQLQIDSDDRKLRLARLHSSHVRQSASQIELRHLWLEMN